MKAVLVTLAGPYWVGSHLVVLIYIACQLSFAVAVVHEYHNVILGIFWAVFTVAVLHICVSRMMYEAAKSMRSSLMRFLMTYHDRPEDDDPPEHVMV